MNQKTRNGIHCTNGGGNFNVRRGTVELCSDLAGRGVKRAAAAAGCIHSDKSSHTAESQSEACLFKGNRLSGRMLKLQHDNGIIFYGYEKHWCLFFASI